MIVLKRNDQLSQNETIDITSDENIIEVLTILLL